ncbi:MAG: HD domain-containing protein [Acidaminococcaceae bacterium]|nr:HD domain-containing protein [Acidaminococcaceae bacterium]MBR1590806.1 HD domain-containing protein [Acidaminococcaceae bacterium]
MLSIPQYLDFSCPGKTKEICAFFLELLKRKSEFLYLHSQQVANYAASVAAKLGLSRKEIGTIRTAALMHDIGLLSVPNSILNKSPYLTTRELAQYKRHCVAGCSMLENMEEFADVIDLIRSHHEKWDGTGYPKRLKGVNIPIGARIIAVADYYDSVINPCTTQWQKSHPEALQELLSGMGTSFDPEIVKAFIDAIAPGKTITPVPVAEKKRAKRKVKVTLEDLFTTSGLPKAYEAPAAAAIASDSAAARTAAVTETQSFTPVDEDVLKVAETNAAAEYGVAAEIKK